MCKTCTRAPIKGYEWQSSYGNDFQSAKLSSTLLWLQKHHLQEHQEAPAAESSSAEEEAQHKDTRGHPDPQGGSGQDTCTVAHHEITVNTQPLLEPLSAQDNQSKTTVKELEQDDQSPTSPHAEKLSSHWARGSGERLEDHWRRLPLFFLGGDEPEDKDQEEELKLLENPDLYPVPKNHNYKTDSPTSLPNLNYKTDSPSSLPNFAATVHFSSSPNSSPQSSPLSPRSPKKNLNTEDQGNIKERIQLTLSRARKKRSSSISGQSGVYSRSISVSSLRGLDGKTIEHDPDYMTTKLCDASTITELCTSENVPEVEIISLVQEQFPQYKLRAETITNFSSYDNSDWGVTFPALKEEEVEALSPEQAEGALAYFVLCGNRVSQMTKTYNDIEAVTRLLQEKEKDLELAAKIGQQLLSRSKVLEERNAGLEAELTSSGDIITQLKHDLQMKTDLLQIYTNDVDDSSCETTPTGLRFINVDILQNRVKNLEAENATLRNEAFQLVEETDEVEDREENLVKDVIKQLGDANSHANQLSEELAKKVEDSLRHQEEITQLLAQVVDLQSRNKHMRHENEELHNMVGVARECQQELTTELAELKEKYAEVLDLLHDTQEQLRRVQKKNLPGRQGSHLSNNIFSSPFNSGGNDSIATELHSLNSIGEELSNSDEAVKNHNMRRAFETVRLTGKYNSGSNGSLSSLGYGSSVISTPTHVPSVMGTPTHMTNSMSQSYNSTYLGSRGSSLYSGESGHPSLDSGADSDASMHTDSEDNYPASRPGVPGWPGTPDLNSCLRRLGPGERSMTPSHYLPYGCRTPDSIMSTDPKNPWPSSPVLSPGSAKSGGSSSSGFGGSDQWKLPQKLQIVKPIEGSLTLHQWSRLATPHLGGLLEEREGVANKGGIGHNLNLEVYSMSDVEEDEEDLLPGKQFMNTSGINTYTNCTILHPDDSTMLTPSYTKTQVSVLPTCSGLTGTTPSTPMRQPSCPASRRGSTATFSTNIGLAKVLNERGMSQAAGWSPTATPANSPSGSRPGSPEPEGYKLPGLDDLTKTFQYGASLLRRTFYKEEVSSGPHSPVGPQVNLLETVQDLGVERLMRPQEMTLSVGGVVTSRPATSPLLHLSNLIMSSAKNTTTTTSTTTSLTCTGMTTTTNVRSSGSLMFTPKLLSSPGERRPSFPPGAPMGIPGHPGAGHLDTRLSQLKPGQRTDLGTVKPGQRSDLGTVGGRQRPTSLGTVPGRGRGADSNVGAVTWMAHGRKGGLY